MKVKAAAGPQSSEKISSKGSDGRTVTAAVTFHDFRPKTSIGVDNQVHSVDKPGDGSRS